MGARMHVYQWRLARALSIFCFKLFAQFAAPPMASSFLSSLLTKPARQIHLVDRAGR